MINDFLKLEKLTPEVMKVLINRIEIHQDKQVDIIFNFKKLNNAYNRNSDINLNLFWNNKINYTQKKVISTKQNNLTK